MLSVFITAVMSANILKYICVDFCLSNASHDQYCSGFAIWLTTCKYPPPPHAHIQSITIT